MSAHALVPGFSTRYRALRSTRRGAPNGRRELSGYDPMWSYAPFTRDDFTELSAGYFVPSIETTGVVMSSDVDTAINTLDPKMAALNAAITGCFSMAPSDVQAWQVAFAAWQQVKTDWQFDKQGSVIPGPIYGPGILDRVQQSQNDYSTFQGKAAAACPATAPPPSPGTVWNDPSSGGGGGGAPATPPGWMCQNFGIGCPTGYSSSNETTWADAVKWIAIASIVVVGLVYVWPTVAALVAAKKIAGSL